MQFALFCKACICMYMYERNFLRTNVLAERDEDFRAYHVPGPRRDALTRHTNNNVKTLRSQRCKASRARNARITLWHYIMMRECNVASVALENRAKKVRILQKKTRGKVHACMRAHAHQTFNRARGHVSSQGNRRLYD